MKERLKLEKMGGTIIIKVTKHYKDKYNAKVGQSVDVDFNTLKFDEVKK